MPTIDDDFLFSLPVPVLGFKSYADADHTALLIKLVSELTTIGLQVVVIRHVLSMTDQSAADEVCNELSGAGADHVLMVSGGSRQDSVREMENKLGQLSLDEMDIILLEGLAELPVARIELHRPSSGNRPIFPGDKSIIAVASDEYLQTNDLPLLNLGSTKEIAGYINRWLRDICRS